MSSESETVFLAGPAVERLIPLLDGTRTVDDIVNQLTDKVAADEVIRALDALEVRGLLHDGQFESTADLAFWELAAIDPGALAGRREAVTIEVVSTGGAPTAGISEGLRSLGIRVETGANFRIVVARDYCRDALAGINEDALARNLPWMLVRPFGRTQWVGPVFVPARTACWRCMAHSLEFNGWRADAILANVSVAAAVTRALAALVAAEWLLTAAQYPMEGCIRALDTLTLESSLHYLIARPQCPACQGRGRQSKHCSIELLTSPLTGIANPLQETEIPAICIAETTSSRVLWPNYSGALFYGDRYPALGKGRTRVEARAACLGEAVERYSCRFHADEPRVTATFAELGERAVHPNALTLYSDAQYARRDLWNTTHNSFHRVGEPFDPEAQVEWTAATAITSGQIRYVPTGYCFMGYDVEFCGANSNGCAAGRTSDEALLNGVLELIERDAVAMWWYNRASRPPVSSSAVQSPRTQSAIDHLRSLGWRTHVLDLTSDFGLPVSVAVGARADGTYVLFGSGAAMGSEESAWRAVSELATLVAFDDPGASACDDASIHSWLQHANFDNQPWLLPSTQDPLRGEGSLANIAGRDAVMESISRVERQGLNVLLVDVTRPELGIPTARVIVPGLRPWWARFAPGRLYDTPVILGWREAPYREEDLNPVPFFL